MNDVDISDVLEEIEGALGAASDSLPSENIQNEIQNLNNMQIKVEENQKKIEAKAAHKKVLTGASNLGSVVLENMRKSAYSTASLALETLEKEEDLSKFSEKMIQSMKVDMEKHLEQKRSELEQHLASNPNLFFEKAVHVIESKQVQEAPGRAIRAVSDFMRSEEVKLAQKLAAEAVKDGLESEQVKALQDRAKKDVDIVSEAVIQKMNRYPFFRKIQMFFANWKFITKLFVATQNTLVKRVPRVGRLLVAMKQPPQNHLARSDGTASM